MSGDSSDPSGQSFSPSQRQPLEMQVTWSLQTNCLGLQVFGAEGRGGKKMNNDKDDADVSNESNSRLKGFRLPDVMLRHL